MISESPLTTKTYQIKNTQSYKLSVTNMASASQLPPACTYAAAPLGASSNAAQKKKVSCANANVAAATRQHNFEQAVAYALHLWPALTLSVSNGWGGADSEEKRDWFAGAIVELFPEFTDAPATTTASSNGNAAPPATAADEADIEDVETVLLQVMVDEFEVNVDDDSALEVAEQIMRARTQCANGQFDETNALAERFLKLRGSKVNQMFKKAEDPNQDTDGDDDDDDDDDDDGSDVDMGDAPAPAPREKPAPEVDEDGFTMVTKKKR